MTLIAVVPDLILILCTVFLFVQSAIVMRDDSTENVSKLRKLAAIYSYCEKVDIMLYSYNI